MLLPGPMHPDLFGGETPRMIESDATFRVFNVTVERTYETELVIAAEDEDEAKEIAQEVEPDFMDFCDTYVRASEVTDITPLIMRQIHNREDLPPDADP